MKNQTLISMCVYSVCLTLLGLVQPAWAAGEVSSKPFWIYKDDGFSGNHFSPDGWMGDHADLKMDMDYKIPALHQVEPYKGNTVIRFDYRPGSKVKEGEGWIGVYFLHPAGNWGNKEEGFDLSAYSRLSFYIKGERGGEMINSFRVGGVSGEFSDSDTLEIKNVKLTDHWQKIILPLSGHDLHHIMGGFAWTATADDNPQGASFLLDNVRFD